LENGKYRLVTLFMTLALVAFLLLAFFLPDYRLFIALALAVLVVRSIMEISSEFIVNAKTILVMVLVGVALLLGIAALYFYFTFVR
jgi:hypothetical protein